ncbi:MAG: hypothetical protein AAF630_16395 [Cyanobacteria bacterium P01_C01_bin.38]
MNKNLKIILRNILILIASGVSIFYLLAFIMSSAWTFLAYGEFRGEKAKLAFEEINEISDTSLTNTYYLVEYRTIDPEYYFRFRTDKELIKKLVKKHRLKEDSIKSYGCDQLLDSEIRQRVNSIILPLSWWNPKNLQADKCYHGWSRSNGDSDLYMLIYDSNSGNAFLYIITT